MDEPTSHPGETSRNWLHLRLGIEFHNAALQALSDAVAVLRKEGHLVEAVYFETMLRDHRVELLKDESLFIGSLAWQVP